jgi:hypothetical protein
MRCVASRKNSARMPSCCPTGRSKAAWKYSRCRRAAGVSGASWPAPRFARRVPAHRADGRRFPRSLSARRQCATQRPVRLPKPAGEPAVRAGRSAAAAEGRARTAGSRTRPRSRHRRPRRARGVLRQKSVRAQDGAAAAERGEDTNAAARAGRHQGPDRAAAGRLRLGLARRGAPPRPCCSPNCSMHADRPRSDHAQFRRRHHRPRRRLCPGRPDRRRQDHHHRQAGCALRGAPRRRQGGAAHHRRLPDRRARAAAHLRPHPRRAGACGARCVRPAPHAGRTARQAHGADRHRRHEPARSGMVASRSRCCPAAATCADCCCSTHRPRRRARRRGARLFGPERRSRPGGRHHQQGRRVGHAGSRCSTC